MEVNKISIIIVAYNSDELIVDAIKSIYKYADLDQSDYEIIVVDNSDTQHHLILKKVIEKNFNDEEILLIHNEKNGGYGQGNNMGIKASSGNIVCIMNPDVRFTEPLMIDVLSKFSNHSLALLGYKQLGGFNYSFYRKPEYKTAFSGWLCKINNKLNFFNSKKDYLSGAFFFINKEKFVEIGMFDENIFLYYEEPDIANRIAAKGYEIILDKSKSYLHLVGNRIAFSEKSFVNEMNALKYYLEKFKIDIKIYHQKIKNEYQLKSFAAQLLNDKERSEKFKKELQKINEIFY